MNYLSKFSFKSNRGKWVNRVAYVFPLRHLCSWNVGLWDISPRGATKSESRYIISRLPAGRLPTVTSNYTVCNIKHSWVNLGLDCYTVIVWWHMDSICLTSSLVIVWFTWWRHQMEPFSALLALWAGNSPVPVNSPHKGQWRGALMFSLICAWVNDWVNNREAGDLRRHRGHHEVIVM